MVHDQGLSLCLRTTTWHCCQERREYDNSFTDFHPRDLTGD